MANEGGQNDICNTLKAYRELQRDFAVFYKFRNAMCFKWFLFLLLKYLFFFRYLNPFDGQHYWKMDLFGIN